MCPIDVRHWETASSGNRGASVEEIILLAVVATLLVLLVLPIVVITMLSQLGRELNVGLVELKRVLREMRQDIGALRREQQRASAEEPQAEVIQEEPEYAEPVEPDEQVITGAPPEGPVPPVPEVHTPPEPLSVNGATSYKTDQPAKPSPRTPSRFEAAARDTLRKMWNWIAVGEEHIPKGVSFEYAFASQWLLRIGILILVVGMGFFLKYSVEHGLINEVGRVALSSIVGLGMLVAGTQMLGRRYHILGQGLMGGGLATLYFAVFASANFYHLIEMSVAFALMSLITALAGAIAIRFNSILVAVLGIIGGYGTPLMLSTGAINFPGLYGYMLVLGIGVLAICYWKNWPLVNYLSFAATYALFFSAMGSYTTDHFWEVMPFLVAFFVLFSTMTFLYKLVNQSKSNLLDLLALWINAGVFFAVSYSLVDARYVRWWVAAVTLSVAAFYTGHVFYFLRRRLVDRELLVSFIGLATFFLAVTMPLVLSPEWVTASWAIQAFVLLWVAGKIGSEFLRQICYLLYGLVLFRFGVIDLTQNFLQASSAADMPLFDYLRQLVERAVMFGVPIASIGGAYKLLSNQEMESGKLVDRKNDIPGWLSGTRAMRLAIGVAAGMLFVYLHLEFNRTFGYLYEPAKLPLLTLLWVTMCGLLLYEAVVRESRAMVGLLLMFVAGLLIKLFVFDLPSWGMSGQMVYGPGYSFRDAALRLIDFGAVIGFLTCGYALLIGKSHARIVGQVFSFAALAMLFVYLTLEVNSFLYVYVDGLRAGGISILWSLFALGMIMRGIAKNIRSLRYLGLGLFAVVTWKVFFVDLSQLEQVYRIVAFIVLGILVLCGSFVYLKYRETFAIEKSSEQEDVA